MLCGIKLQTCSDASPTLFLQGKATQKDVDFLADVNAEERDSFMKRNYHNLYNGEMRIKETMLAEWREMKKTWNLYEKVGAKQEAYTQPLALGLTISCHG